jgi:hypothetical protein
MLCADSPPNTPKPYHLKHNTSFPIVIRPRPVKVSFPSNEQINTKRGSCFALLQARWAAGRGKHQIVILIHRCVARHHTYIPFPHLHIIQVKYIVVYLPGIGILPFHNPPSTALEGFL